MLAVSHVAHAGDRLLSVLVIDRVLPPLERNGDHETMTSHPAGALP